MPADVMYPVYKAGPIEPAVAPYQNIAVWVNKVWRYYTVDYIEGIPRSSPLLFDFVVATGAVVAAAAATGVQQLTLLRMPDKELGHFRLYVLDDMEFELWQGRSDGRNRLMNVQARSGLFSDLRDPCGHLSTFFMHEDDWAFGNCFNPSATVVLARARVAFYGYRYVLSGPLAAKPDMVTYIPATAHL